MHLVGPSSAADPAQNYPGTRPDAAHSVNFDLCRWQAVPRLQRARSAGSLLHPPQECAPSVPSTYELIRDIFLRRQLRTPVPYSETGFMRVREKTKKC